MKRITLLYVTLIALALAGCDKSEVLGPTLALYKTKADYFEFANTWGRTNGPTSFDLSDSRIKVVDGDTIYTRRYKMEKGYILGIEISSDEYFTDIKFKEIVAYNEEQKRIHGTSTYNFNIDSLLERIIDKDPFTEFYSDDNRHFESQLNQENINLINELILSDKIDSIFIKLK